MALVEILSKMRALLEFTKRRRGMHVPWVGRRSAHRARLGSGCCCRTDLVRGMSAWPRPRVDTQDVLQASWTISTKHCVQSKMASDGPRGCHDCCRGDCVRRATHGSEWTKTHGNNVFFCSDHQGDLREAIDDGLVYSFLTKNDGKVRVAIVWTKTGKKPRPSRRRGGRIWCAWSARSVSELETWCKRCQEKQVCTHVCIWTSNITHISLWCVVVSLCHRVLLLTVTCLMFEVDCSLVLVLNASFFVFCMSFLFHSSLFVPSFFVLGSSEWVPGLGMLCPACSYWWMMRTQAVAAGVRPGAQRTSPNVAT